MLAKLRSQLRARGICKSQKRNLALPVFILSTIRFLVRMSAHRQGCAVVVMVQRWWSLQALP